MATSGTILSGQLHGTSEEGRANGNGLGGKAAFITLRQSEAGLPRHVPAIPLFAFPHYDFLSPPPLRRSPLALSFLRHSSDVEQILQARGRPSVFYAQLARKRAYTILLLV